MHHNQLFVSVVMTADVNPETHALPLPTVCQHQKSSNQLNTNRITDDVRNCFLEYQLQTMWAYGW